MGPEKVSVEKNPINFQSETLSPTEFRETKGAVHVCDTWKSCARFLSERCQQPERKRMLQMKVPQGENLPTLHGPHHVEQEWPAH